MRFKESDKNQAQIKVKGLRLSIRKGEYVHVKHESGHEMKIYLFKGLRHKQWRITFEGKPRRSK